ncbi:MAG: hypothetical protein ACR2MN_07180 [Acidimicrobiales bacterium]
MDPYTAIASMFFALTLGSAIALVIRCVSDRRNPHPDTSDREPQPTTLCHPRLTNPYRIRPAQQESDRQ